LKFVLHILADKSVKQTEDKNIMQRNGSGQKYLTVLRKQNSSVNYILRES